MYKNLLNEEITRIKTIMGMNEQVTLPMVVSGVYPANSCDELHAFQGTGGKVIGNMNKLVQDKIGELNKQGLMVKVTGVDVKVSGMNVSWSVTISKSDDGKNWVGFTSRGAGCNQNVSNRWNDEGVGNGINSIKEKIKSVGIGDVDEIELVRKFEYNGGDNSFVQGFYRYCLVGENKQEILGEPINITSSDLSGFLNDIKTKTMGKGVDLGSVKIDVDNLTFSINPGKTKILKMVLAISLENRPCESCESIIRGNSEYGAEKIREGKFQNNTRIYNLIVLYPKH